MLLSILHYFIILRNSSWFLIRTVTSDLNAHVFDIHLPEFAFSSAHYTYTCIYIYIILPRRVCNFHEIDGLNYNR